MEMLLSRLREFDALRDIPSDGRCDTVLIRTLPSQTPAFAPAEYLDQFPSFVRDILKKQGIETLYTHQAEAINLIRDGKDVVLEAPTASGKTLCFNIPLVLSLLEDPTARVLMIHPMKALSNDQRRQFEEFARPLEPTLGRRLESWIFDGDLDPEHRKLLKVYPPEVLFTNPEMLHASFLGWHEQWTGFLKKLRFVIIDEIHEYRGYFGTNMALLFRRFLAKLAQLGVHPQIVLATATCRNATEHAYRLTGRRCTLVRALNAMRPERHFAFINPDIPDFVFHDIYRLRIARAALACVAEGLTALVFCPSRKFAEETAIQAQKDANDYGLDPETIAPYRSGYDANLRRQIEDGLREGLYRAVFSTNALEIGIDIGRLDVCIMAGFPDSIFSAWQRIGRVGRRWDSKAYVLYYALNNPFDQFYANNIDAFLNKPLDEILIGIDNEELMSRHLPYLIQEVGPGLKEELRFSLGNTFFNFATRNVQGKKPVSGIKPNYQRLSIRGGSGMTYRLIYKHKEIGTISDVHLFHEAYVGAIYRHFGKSYLVTAHTADEVLLEDADPHLRTEGIFYTVIQEGEILSGLRYGENLMTCYGKLTIFDNFAGFRVVDTRTGEVRDEFRSQLARSSNVRGFWLQITDTSSLGCLTDIQHLFGLEQLLRIGAPFIVPCDRHDLGTLTSKPATVYLYETVPGGIGIAEKALEVWPEIINTALDIAERCSCKHGCPSCIVPPRLPPNFDEPRKEPAIAIGRRLLSLIETLPCEQYDPSTHMWIPLS